MPKWVIKRVKGAGHPGAREGISTGSWLKACEGVEVNSFSKLVLSIKV